MWRTATFLWYLFCVWFLSTKKAFWKKYQEKRTFVKSLVVCISPWPWENMFQGWKIDFFLYFHCNVFCNIIAQNQGLFYMLHKNNHSVKILGFFSENCNYKKCGEIKMLHGCTSCSLTSSFESPSWLLSEKFSESMLSGKLQMGHNMPLRKEWVSTRDSHFFHFPGVIFSQHIFAKAKVT